MLLVDRRCSSSRGGISSRRDGCRLRPASSARSSSPSCCSPARSQLQAARERAIRRRAATRTSLYLHVGHGRCGGCRGALHRAGRRPLLDPRDSVLRRHQAAAATRGRRRRSRRRRWPPIAADDYPLLYPLLDLTTTLDPRFNIAYRFGAVFLAEPYPARRRPARSGDRAARKGFARTTR